jgi:hypothetical protein
MFLRRNASVVKNITVQEFTSYKTIPGYSPEDRMLFLPQWSRGGTVWPEVADRKKIILHWKNGGTHERVIGPNSTPGADQFIASCVEEHEQPSPHSLLPTLSKITVQEWTAQGWSPPTTVWPSN